MPAKFARLHAPPLFSFHLEKTKPSPDSPIGELQCL
jgi:hypothetical protein